MTDDEVRLRRAHAADLDFLTELAGHEEVEPYLAAGRPHDREALAAEIARSQEKPQEFGRFVIELREGERWRAAGTLRFAAASSRNRIADLGGLAVHPWARGRRIGDEAARLIQRHLLEDLGYHRLQLEIYGFNERALAHAKRVGFRREGLRRRAYRRDGEWVDGVLFGLIAEDLSERR